MRDQLISVDCSDVHEGKLEELEAAMKELVAFVDANEPRPLAYHVYFSDAGDRMTVFQVHPDSASMEEHMEIAGSAFPQLSEFLTLTAIDLYGAPSERLLDQLRRKAEMLGPATLAVHRLHAGFTRRFGR